LGDYSFGQRGLVFADDVNGFYQYIKLTVFSSRKGYLATSRDFSVTTMEMNEGTNIALGMKGNSGSWSPGWEHERAFDGDLGTAYCANDGSFPQWCGVEWEYMVYVDTLEIYVKDYGTTNFEIEILLENGSWVKLVEAADFVGTHFKFDVKQEVKAVIYRVFYGPGWANLVEMIVNGFRDFNLVKPGEDIQEYDFEYLSYLDRLAIVNTVGDFKIEASRDGENWEEIANEDTELTDGYLLVEDYYQYLRYNENGEYKKDNLKIFGTQLIRDLAQGLQGKVSDYSDENFNAEKATTNPEHVDGRNQFWCASTYGGEHWLMIDLGNPSVIKKVRQKFQDTGSYKFKILASLDGETWITLRDEYDGAVEGQVFDAYPEEDNNLFRYIALYEKDVSWANSNQFQVFGVGSPVQEEWWQSESGVIRYYLKQQAVTINQITDLLPYFQESGYKVLELHQPYEGLADIWGGLGSTNNYQIDPIVGTHDDLKILIDEAHKAGIYVFMFGNVGYARSTAAFFEKACRDYALGIESAERDWFLFSKTCPDPTKWFWSDTANAFYYGFWGENGQIPTYNFDNEAWRQETTKYVTYWANFGFDGIALDAPPVYYWGSADPVSTSYRYITNPLAAMNVMTIPEGTSDANFIYQYNYDVVQNYNLSSWGAGGWTLALEKAMAHNAEAIDEYVRLRDNAVQFYGVSFATLTFEQMYENVTSEEKLMEAALLVTTGHMAFLHSGSSAMIGQDILLDWPKEVQEKVASLYALQNSFAGLNANGARNKLYTNNDDLFYASFKTNMSGSLKNISLFNFSDKTETVTVDVSNIGTTSLEVVNLLTGEVEEVMTENGKLIVEMESLSYKIYRVK
jgi:glycosidase